MGEFVPLLQGNQNVKHAPLIVIEGRGRYPELDICRNNPQPTPKRWHGYLLFALEAFLNVLDLLLQNVPVREDRRLPTGPSADPRTADPACIPLTTSSFLSSENI